MSVFEPEIVRTVIKNALPVKEHGRFEKDWNTSVNDHVGTWKVSNPHAEEATAHAQFTWAAHAIAYVEFLHTHTKPPPRSPAGTKPLPLTLKVPIYGPRFVPPEYLHVVKRTPSTKVPKVKMETTYLKPLTVIHPFYHAPRLSVCPRCRGNNVSWDSWTATGPRSVYGVRRPEMALGYQVRCVDCKALREKLPANERHEVQYSYATTSDKFWEKWEYWQIPLFFHKCAVTRDLLDLIIELRLSSTSGGLAENIKVKLHLLEYHQAIVDFLDSYKRYSVCGFTDITLDSFLAFDSPDGWGGRTISAESITKILLQNSTRTRSHESSDYLKTLTAVSVSIDATFESTKKAVITNSSLVRTNPSGGGLFSGINEWNEILFWKLSQTMSNAEIIEALDGLKNRHLVLERPLPEIATADNCCHVRNAILCVFPEIHVVLDVYHFLMRYGTAVVDGKRNVFYYTVIEDIREAILLKKADNDSKAVYRTQGDQELRLEAAYQAWAQHGGVWSAAALRVHEAQMNHVKKGCLARHRQDIATDGSRIEGTHKGWNSLMRSHACGLEVFVALGHDHVLRRNVHVAIARPEPPEFIASSEGSHHLRLVNHIAKLWNSLLETRRRNGHPSPDLVELPRLPRVASGESFGVVRSIDAESYGGLLTAKDDPLDVDLMEMLEQSELDIQAVSSQLQIAPDLFLREDASAVGTIVQRAIFAQSGRASDVRKQSAPSTSPDDPTLAAARKQTMLAQVLTSRSNGTVAAVANDTTLMATPSTVVTSLAGATIDAKSSAHDEAGPSDVVDLTLADDDSESDAEHDFEARPPTGRPKAQGAKRKARNSQALTDAQPAVKKARFIEDADTDKQPKIIVQGTQLGRAGGASGLIDDFFRSRKPPSQVGCSSGAASESTKRDLPPAAMQDSASTSEPSAPSPSTGPPAAHAAANVGCSAAAANDPATTRKQAATSKPATAARTASTGGRQAGAAHNSAATSSRTRTAVSPAAAQTTALTAPLPIPSSPAGLSRTEHMWSFLTRMSAHSMTIARSGLEFLVFMEARAEQQWSMATMSPRRWVTATSSTMRNSTRDTASKICAPVLKHPRALVDKLDEVEDKIISRILKDDYKSRPPNGKCRLR
ncbi:hypothetical protein EWM64_g4258 [Hericium alpestre]|uniref:Uncharacterized protein n=1 Tax=Hericium alpestre TaxID=135208 RepID=A0A4Y9ZZ41_9AGAM|nr:hypothetical protein EWM64_g4258 [Hericium alpestre]